MLKTDAKPSDYRLNFTGSGLGSCEAEQVTKNIMIMLKSQGDEIKPFTWAGYKNFCSHRVTNNEKKIIDLLVHGGKYYDNIGGHSYIPSDMIEKIGDKETYAFTEKFMKIIKEFKK